MALHHQTLKAAIAKYAPMVAEGKTEEEVKAEISKDDKEFNEEAVSEIYASIIKPEEPKQPALVVAVEFRDINDFNKVYRVGEEPHDIFSDAERLKNLIELGLVKKND